MGSFVMNVVPRGRIVELMDQVAEIDLVVNLKSTDDNLVKKNLGNERLHLWTRSNTVDCANSEQSGCCKPPAAYNYNMTTTVSQDPVCYRWNNALNFLCYECDSCKAGLLENIIKDWHKLYVLNILMLVVLIGIYSIGCCAFQNTRA